MNTPTPLLALSRRGLLASVLLACASLAAHTAAQAAEIRVITSGAFTEAYKKLVPIFEAASGHTVISAVSYTHLTLPTKA